jgi:flagellar motor switch protein FliN/FliY
MSAQQPNAAPPGATSTDSSTSSGDPGAPNPAAMSMLRDVEVEVTLEIGRRRMRIADVLKLASGQTLELAKAAGEPLDVFVNGRLLGRGEAIVLGDRYGVRITEIVSAPDEGTS